MGKSSSFLRMTLGVIAILLIFSLFSSVLGTSGSSGLIHLLEHPNITTFTGLSTVIAIVATVLLLGLVFAASYFGVYKGYASAATADPSGIIRIVYGIVELILFITLFYNIMTDAYTLYSHTNASSFTAFTTVVAIMPTILFLGGLFTGGAIGVGGAKQTYRRYGRRQLS